MVRGVLKLFLVFVLFTQMGASCEGTECGNPKECSSIEDTPIVGDDTATYSNDDFGVTAGYDGDWTVEEGINTTADADSPGDATPAAPVEGINTNEASFALFEGESSTVTLYFVTLTKSQAASGLENYLESVFPSRTFEEFSNDNLSGFKFDNEEAGTTGGDLQEYYFLEGTTLLYVVTDLFEEDGGATSFETLIDSLQFN